jgi:hypothetical protein
MQPISALIGSSKATVTARQEVTTHVNKDFVPHSCALNLRLLIISNVLEIFSSGCGVCFSPLAAIMQIQTMQTRVRDVLYFAGTEDSFTCDEESR